MATIKVLDDVQSFVQIKNPGIPTGGAAATAAALKTSIVTAEFPSQRASAIDNSYNSSSLYNNGLLFTAYNIADGLAPGSKESYRSFRSAAAKLANATSVRNIQSLNTGSSTQKPICQILLPRSVNDNEVNTHRYQDATDSLMSKGLSRVVSNMIWGSIDSVAGGILADRRETMDVGTKSAFQGSDKRTKMYYNTFVIENRNDLLELIKIYYLFTTLSYGATSGGTPEVVANKIISAYNSAVNETASYVAKTTNSPMIDTNSSTVGEYIAKFVTNVEIIKAPPVWFIRDFQSGDSLRLPHSTFGPAGITSVRFGRSMDNIVNTLRESPNTPISLEIEIQFTELIDMRQDSIFDLQY